jgi:hypothetical protein
MKLATSLALVALTAAFAAGAAPITQSTRVIGAVDVAYVASSGPVVFLEAPVRSGTGTVIALIDPTGPTANVSRQLVTMQMDDGSVQRFVVEGVQLEFHERIRVNQDGFVTRRLPK